MRVITEANHPVKLWADYVEPTAREQLIKTANLPFIYKHVAAMPDVHAGKGSTVGSVIATTNAIMPAAVGVDIGCGMLAAKIDCPVPLDELKAEASKIRSAIERYVPVGFSAHEAPQENAFKWEGWNRFPELNAAVYDLKHKAQTQCGTLGGGNHFIEVCEDSDGNPWVMIHSGSRGIGKKVADYHIHESKKLMDMYHVILEDKDHAFFASRTPQIQAYLHDLYWCQGYAKVNRSLMLNLVFRALDSIFKGVRLCAAEPGAPNIEGRFMVDCHHNYVATEQHFGQNVFVTRKGAVRARLGDFGIIPGSMGAKSYIVEGLGNRQSFHSCSHGAGRKMSRTKARNSFTEKDLEAQTSGVECRKDAQVIDEIPSAYKDIDEVMSQQRDLVSVYTELKQFVCVKG